MLAYVITLFREVWSRFNSIRLNTGLGIDISLLHLMITFFVVGTLINLLTGSSDDLDDD